MNFLLKIVRGPNAGAEAALPDGISITLGKSDNCDIVLADPTLPDAPMTLEAKSGGVALDGNELKPFHVQEAGSTAFAVGPASGAWEKLVWPEPEEQKAPEAAKPAETAPAPKSEASEKSEKKKSSGCLGCSIALVLLILGLAAAGWFYKDALSDRYDKIKDKIPWAARNGSESESAEEPPRSPEELLGDISAKYGLSMSEGGGRAKLSGDFKTRAERLAATAEAFAAKPGVELDFSDAESLKTAVEDTLALVEEKDLRIASVSNRVVALAGRAVDLRRALEALAADVPALGNVDCRLVSIPSDGVKRDTGADTWDFFSGAGTARNVGKQKKKNLPVMPICGILEKPYPCLVMRDGSRMTEGAPYGGGVIAGITADSITITNATGRFVWKP